MEPHTVSLFLTKSHGIVFSVKLMIYCIWRHLVVARQSEILWEKTSMENRRTNQHGSSAVPSTIDPLPRARFAMKVPVEQWYFNKRKLFY